MSLVTFSVSHSTCREGGQKKKIHQVEAYGGRVLNVTAEKQTAGVVKSSLTQNGDINTVFSAQISKIASVATVVSRKVETGGIN